MVTSEWDYKETRQAVLFFYFDFFNEFLNVNKPERRVFGKRDSL